MQNILAKYSFRLVILLNLIIILTKLFVYNFTNSIAVFSSLTDSILDLVISSINSIIFIYATKPKDDDHKFGHAAIEDLVSLLQIILIFVSSVFMFYKTLGIKENYHFSWQYLFFMLLNAFPLLLIILIQVYNKRRTSSTIVDTDLLHYSTDFFTLAGVVLAMILTHFTQILWFDILCGAFVILVIAYSCFEGVVQAFNNLMAREIGRLIALATIALP
jgi:ferrous-iron efflux pump FieF